MKVHSANLICEGDALAFDGEGTVIITESIHPGVLEYNGSIQ